MNFDDWKDDLIKKVEAMMQANPEWRYGQTVFNVMTEMGLGDYIRGNKLDCFYFEPQELNEAWWMTVEFVYNELVMK